MTTRHDATARPRLRTLRYPEAQSTAAQYWKPQMSSRQAQRDSAAFGLAGYVVVFATARPRGELAKLVGVLAGLTTHRLLRFDGDT
jgi:hypothetical protein